MIFIAVCKGLNSNLLDGFDLRELLPYLQDGVRDGLRIQPEREMFNAALQDLKGLVTTAKRCQCKRLAAHGIENPPRPSKMGPGR